MLDVFIISDIARNVFVFGLWLSH